MLPAQPAERTQPVSGGFPQFYLNGHGISGVTGGGFASLEQHLEMVAAAVAWNQPRSFPAVQQPPVSLKTHLQMRYNPVLVRESPDAEPTVRMVPRSSSTFG